MYVVGNVYVIAAVAVVGGALFGMYYKSNWYKSKLIFSVKVLISLP